MGVKFKSPLELSGHRAILHTDAAQTLVVKVVTKTAAHPEHGNGSSSGYTIDGVEGAYLEFTPGNTYKFDQSDSSNSSHPLRFYEDAAKTTAYTTGVTTSGTAGSSGAYTQIIPTISTPPVLFYQCSAHSLMGSYVKFGTATAASSNTTYTINSVTSGSDAIIRLTGSDSSTDDVTLEAGSNVTITETGDTITIASTDTNTQTESFKTISVSGQSDVVADSSTDTLTLAAGSNVTITTNASTDTITFAATDTNTTYTAGTGISLTGTTFALNAAIEDLTNVSSTSPTTGQVLKWDGSSWAPGTDSAGAGASNSFETIAISGQSSVVADSATDTLTLVAGNNVTLTTDASTDTITIASSGSSSLNVEKNILTGDGSTTAFTVSSSIASENNTQVYIDGVYQSKDNYSTSGSTVTFTTAPANGAEIEIIHFVSVQGAIKVDSFTGDNSTVTFTTGASIIDEVNTQIYIDGVYQSKDNYTTSGNNVTFSTAPGTGAIIEVVHIKAIDLSTIVGDQLTGDGSTVAFTLSRSIDDENNTFVFINGVYQDKSTYSLSGTTLTFSTAPQNGYTIEVMSFDSISIASTGVTSFNGSTGAVTGVASFNGNTGVVTGVASFNGNTGAVTGVASYNGNTGVVSSNYNISSISSNTTAVKNTLYVFKSNLTLTLPASPSNGDSIKISNRSGVTTCVVARNSEKIMGDSSDLTIDKLNAGIELIYSGSTDGWVIIGVEGT